MPNPRPRSRKASCVKARYSPKHRSAVQIISIVTETLVFAIRNLSVYLTRFSSKSLSQRSAHSWLSETSPSPARNSGMPPGPGSQPRNGEMIMRPKPAISMPIRWYSGLLFWDMYYSIAASYWVTIPGTNYLMHQAAGYLLQILHNQCVVFGFCLPNSVYGVCTICRVPSALLLRATRATWI